jgi:hypothetical protein
LEIERQRVVDEEHLRLLALFHYISGAVTLAFSLLFGIWILFAGAMLAFIPHGPAGSAEAVPPHVQAPFIMMMVVFALFFLLGVAYGVLEIVSGRFMALRRRRVFSLVVAIPGLLLIPYGTILSIFTLLVIERPSVKQLYRESSTGKLP